MFSPLVVLDFCHSACGTVLFRQYLNMTVPLCATQNFDHSAHSLIVEKAGYSSAQDFSLHCEVREKA
jgi:hypothetical protein